MTHLVVHLLAPRNLITGIESRHQRSAVSSRERARLAKSKARHFVLEELPPSRDARLVRPYLVLILVALHMGHARADEPGRIRAHLRAAQRLLHARDVSELTPPQREHRSIAIAVLERYIERGVFPRRTSDSYGPLRPRFIDDRGVHCAVGEMIAETGSPELARQLNAEYEYAFVRDMKSPQLLSWAEAHGFTVDELAAIQPAYAKPDDDSTWVRLEARLDELALACVGDEAPPDQVELTIRRAGGETHASTTATDEFSRCIAETTQTLVKGSLVPMSNVFHVPSLDQMVELRLRPADCAPRSGKFPRKATIDFGTGSVITEPPNEDVNACLAHQLEHGTEIFGRRPKLQARITIAPEITNQRINSILLEAPKAAWKCVAQGDPAQIKVVVHASEGDKDFTISIPGANAKFQACVRAELIGPLRGLLSAYAAHRVDSDVEATVTFKLVHQR